jgi:predicted nuclease with TOPRIM domain
MIGKIEMLVDYRNDHDKKCSSQKNIIASLRKDNDAQQIRVEMLQQRTKNTREELQAVLVERNELDRKCNSQNSIIKSLQQQIDGKEIKMERLQHNTKSMAAKLEPLEEDRDRLARKLHEAEVNTPSSLPRALSLPMDKPVMSPSSRISKVFNTHINSKKASYSGPLRENIPNGMGVVRFESGENYFGEVVNGEMHGNGTIFYPGGSMDRGRFEHNVFRGAK